MIPVLSVEAMRAADAAAIAAGTPGTALMRRAGEGIFAAGKWTPPVAVVCGSGNNAGDGYVLALLLQEHGIDCRLFLLSEKWSPDGRYYYEQCLAAGIPAELLGDAPDFSGYGSIADCIFGTGFSGEPRGRAKAAIEAVNRSGAYVVSADINSGLSGNSGMAKTAVEADLTVSVGYYQPGHFLNMAKDLIKEKTDIDIGVSAKEYTCVLVQQADVRPAFPPRKHFSNKSDYGYIGLVGGSARYSGAIRLAAMANAAMRGGAGVVKLAVPASLCAALRPEMLESTLFPLSNTDGNIDFREAEAAELTRGLKAVAFGMGVGREPGAAALLRWLLERFSGTLLIDADGLTLLAKEDAALLDSTPAKVILTPHNMEFSRLSGRPIEEILADPIPLAKAYAERHRVTLLLKGPTTVITDGARTWLTDRGCPGMATAGSGDVLSGVIAALCGYNGDPLLAAAAGAYTAGLAGELAEAQSGAVGMTAGDTANHIAEAIRQITEGTIR